MRWPYESSTLSIVHLRKILLSIFFLSFYFVFSLLLNSCYSLGVFSFSLFHFVVHLNILIRSLNVHVHFIALHSQDACYFVRHSFLCDRDIEFRLVPNLDHTIVYPLQNSKPVLPMSARASRTYAHFCTRTGMGI